MVDDSLAEARSFAGIGERGLERRTGHSDRLRRDADAPALEIGKRDPVTFAFASEQIRRGNAAIREHDLRGIRRALPELFLDPVGAIARRLGVDDERRYALLAGGLVRYREHNRDVGGLARGDELLDAVEDEALPRPLRTSGDRARVGAGVRLG